MSDRDYRCNGHCTHVRHSGAVRLMRTALTEPVRAAWLIYALLLLVLIAEGVSEILR